MGQRPGIGHIRAPRPAAVAAVEHDRAPGARNRAVIGQRHHGRREWRPRIVFQKQLIRQRGQRLEHVGGKRGQLVVVQKQRPQRGHPTEHVGGKRDQRVIVQVQTIQRGQPVEHAGGKRGQ